MLRYVDGSDAIAAYSWEPRSEHLQIALKRARKGEPVDVTWYDYHIPTPVFETFDRIHREGGSMGTAYNGLIRQYFTGVRLDPERLTLAVGGEGE